jgi:hypothetical protein
MSTMSGYNYLPPILLYIFKRFVFNVLWELFNCLIIIIFNYVWLFIVFIKIFVITAMSWILNMFNHILNI